MAQEFTKEEIFNMSDEEFEKHYGEIKNQGSMGDFFQQDESANQQVDNQVENTPQDTQQVENKNLDKDFKVWNNSNNVTQTDVTPEPKEGEGEQNTDDSNTTPEPIDEGDDGVQIQQPQQQIYEVKAYGQKYNFTVDELKELAPKALHYIKKLQKIAPYRRTISAMEQNGVTEDDINQFIEMKKGNKSAINNFLSKNKIDAYELSLLDTQESEKYQPLQYGTDNTKLMETLDEIREHPRSGELEYYLKSLDKESIKRIGDNPEVLETLMSNIENGYFDIISPEANKRAFLDGNKKPMIEYYADVANEYYAYLDSKDKAQINKQRQQQQQQQNVARDNVRAKTKMSGNLGKPMNTQSRQIRSGYDLTDEEFEQFEKDFGRLMG